MSATGSKVSTKTLQTTNLWLDEIMALPAAGGRGDEIHSTR
ncbi:MULTISPECIES: hypothetical protein [unclassified Mesorhizobium]|nr:MULTISPECIES: hypothetical protein [unclassified Mesorhizobium]